MAARISLQLEKYKYRTAAESKADIKIQMYGSASFYAMDTMAMNI